MTNLELRITKLSKTFRVNGSRVRALADFNMIAVPGEFIVIVGANGAGKTTILNLIGGDYGPDSGSIVLAGPNKDVELTTTPRWQRAKYIARVYQNTSLGTVANLTVLENLQLALTTHGTPSPFSLSLNKAAKAEFRRRLRSLGLTDKMNSQIIELSQGQRQILTMELAVLRNPSVMLLDEHTASLDRQNATRCLEATSKLCQATKTTVLMVTHNLADAICYGDRLVVLREGSVAADLDSEAKKQLDVAELFDLCGYSKPHTSHPEVRRNNEESWDNHSGQF